jgi:hypothetical protein
MKASLNRRGLCATLLLLTLLAGCAAESVDLFVRPGRFNYLNCTEIAAATRTTAAREQELKTLIERAEKETFGVLVAAAAYRSDLLRTQGELKQLAETAQDKKCAPEPAAQRSPSARR